MRRVKSSREITSIRDRRERKKVFLLETDKSPIILEEKNRRIFLREIEGKEGDEGKG